MNTIKIILLFLHLFLLQSCAATSGLTRFPTHSFVKVHTKMTLKVCIEQSDKSSCSSSDFYSVGSGAIIKNDNQKTYILTAAHVCHSELEEPVNKFVTSQEMEFKIETYENKYYDFKVKNIAKGFAENKSDIDLCILEGERLRIPSLKLALRGPKIGEQVYNMAAPGGIYHPPTVPLLSGYFSGPVNEHHDLITVPAIGGSSGSPLLNKDGELIGVIFAASLIFPNISISMDFDSTRDFVFESLNP
jgi:S1-C subfamily serine protease